VGRITEKPVREYDLRSAEVIRRLKEGDHLLIDEIASRLFANILRAAHPEMQATGEQAQKLDRLKWVLHNHVEILGLLHECDEWSRPLIGTDKSEASDALNELDFRLDKLSLQLMTLYDESGYSTWNLLHFLNPSYYDSSGSMPSSLLEEFVEASSNPAIRPPDFDGWGEELITMGAEKRVVEAARQALAELLLWATQYMQAVNFSYKVERHLDALYALHYVESIGARLLSLSIMSRLLVGGIGNHLK
jgi:hypothetical protein